MQRATGPAFRVTGAWSGNGPPTIHLARRIHPEPSTAIRARSVVSVNFDQNGHPIELIRPTFPVRIRLPPLAETKFVFRAALHNSELMQPPRRFALHMQRNEGVRYALRCTYSDRYSIPIPGLGNYYVIKRPIKKSLNSHYITALIEISLSPNHQPIKNQQN